MQEKTLYQELYRESERNNQQLKTQLKWKAEQLEDLQREVEWLQRELSERMGQISAFRCMLCKCLDLKKGA